MIQRFTDGLKKSASKAEEFSKSLYENKTQDFVDFIEGIKTSAGSAHQLAHSRQETRWLDVRDRLEHIIELGKFLPMAKNDDRNLWLQIKSALDGMREIGLKMANSKAQLRSEVLMDLNIREAASKTEDNG